MMDAVKFVKTLGRMCDAECIKCEFWKRRSSWESCNSWQKNHPEEAVAIAEKWAKEHPIKTRQSVFLERYPEAAISKDGAIAICPLAISAAYRHGNGACNKGNSDTCADCKRQFWSAEVEE
nr:MAG TPA: hypothetical protein [Caudoviricetes sp.]